MAQTKASASRRRATSNSRTRASKTSQSRSNASRTRSANRPGPHRMGAAGRKPSKRRSSPAPRTLPRSRDLREKAKTPLLTGGAALAGVAGAAVLTARSRRRRKVLGIPLPKRNGLKWTPKRSRKR